MKASRSKEKTVCTHSQQVCGHTLFFMWFSKFAIEYFRKKLKVLETIFTSSFEFFKQKKWLKISWYCPFKTGSTSGLVVKTGITSAPAVKTGRTCFRCKRLTWWVGCSPTLQMAHSRESTQLYTLYIHSTKLTWLYSTRHRAHLLSWLVSWGSNIGPSDLFCQIHLAVLQSDQDPGSSHATICQREGRYNTNCREMPHKCTARSQLHQMSSLSA